MLALHTPIDARRRLVRGARLAHDPERLVVPALRALDARLRQRLRDLIEDEGVGRLLLPRPCDLRDGRVLPREGTLVATRIAMHFPLLRIQERTAFRTEHEGTDPPKGACDKKLARSELRVIVIRQRAFDEPLDRALLGLCAHLRRSSGRLPSLGLFVFLVGPDVRRMSMRPALRCVSVRNAMGPSGHDVLALIFVVLRFLFVSTARTDQAIAARFADFPGDLAEELEIIRVASAMPAPSRRSDRDRMPVGSGANGSSGAMDLLVLFVRLFLIVDVRPRSENRLNEIDAQRATGSGAGLQRAPGLLRDQPADVREDHDHEV